MSQPTCVRHLMFPFPRCNKKIQFLYYYRTQNYNFLNVDLKVIPLIRNLKRHVAALVEEDGTPAFDLRNALHFELNSRFRNMEANWPMSLGTYLDPR